MKLRNLSQLALASGIGLAVAATLTACQLVTVDYVYLAGSSGIQTFAVDSQSGALRYANSSEDKPVSTGGSSPVAMAVDGTYANLYVANADNNSLVHFTLAADGTLTQADSITLPDVPTAIAVTPAGDNIFVTTGTTAAYLLEYPLSSGKIGSLAAQEPLQVPSHETDVVIPTAVTVLENGSAVYATIYDKSAYNPGGTTTSSANPGWVFGYGITSGVLAPTAQSPYRAGVKPSGIAAEPSNHYVYITDFASNQMIGYSITSGTTLNYLISGPYRTGNQPSALAIDPRGKYIYVANALDSTVTAFAIALGTGIPSAAASTTGSTSNVTDTQPDAVIVEPAEGRYVYTANTVGNSVSGFRLNPNTGVITQTQNTPYPSQKTPTVIVAVPHGNHSNQVTID